MPIFDKSRLMSDEFAPYHYVLEFKETSVRDMGVGGYMTAIRPYQAGGYRVEHIATHIMGATIYCQVRVQIPLLSGMVFESLGDADNRGKPDGDTCLRTAESVAFKRAVCRALNISPVDFGNSPAEHRRSGGRDDAPTRPRRDAGSSRGIDLAKIGPSKPPAGNSLGAKGIWDKCH